MIPTAIALAAAFGAFFEVHTFPLDRPSEKTDRAEAQTFFANADSDEIADLFVLQQNKVAVASSATGLRETMLPQGVSAFDVADLDADGKFEIVAIHGTSVVRLALGLQGGVVEPVKLFEAESLYARASAIPTPAVLVVSSDETGNVALALPTDSGMELRALDGALIRTQEYAQSRNRMIVGRPTSFRTGESLNLNFLAGADFQLDAGSGPAGGVDGVAHYSEHNSAGALREAAAEQPVNWPWFVVRNEKAKTSRAYCAVEESLNTLVRMADVAIDADGTPASIAAPGPERRYPGAMIPIGDAPPDFDGDGYADLLLWNAPRPGISVDALLRAVVGRNWPMTLTVHLYSPDKGRFEPMPATELVYRVPVTWFLTGGVPLRNYVLADFNGDKKTDLAMCTSENEYSVWLYSDGFAAAPDETHTFTENITGIELTGDVAGNGKTSIVLRSDGHVYALYAK